MWWGGRATWAKTTLIVYDPCKGSEHFGYNSNPRNVHLWGPKSGRLIGTTFGFWLESPAGLFVTPTFPPPNPPPPPPHPPWFGGFLAFSLGRKLADYRDPALPSSTSPSAQPRPHSSPRILGRSAPRGHSYWSTQQLIFKWPGVSWAHFWLL